MKYICLGYIDHNAFGSILEAEQHAMMDRCCAYDEGPHDCLSLSSIWC
jgi:hypothetical protein